MKKNILASIFAVTASLTLTQSALSQDVISDVKSAVIAEKADVAAVVKAAAAANPAQAAEIAQAAVIALKLKSNDSDDEATIEAIMQAAINGSNASPEYAKSIRALSESALLQPDQFSVPIDGGDTVLFRDTLGNPLNFPVVRELIAFNTALAITRNTSFTTVKKIAAIRDLFRDFLQSVTISNDASGTITIVVNAPFVTQLQAITGIDAR